MASNTRQTGDDAKRSLLGQNDPSPVQVLNLAGTSRFLLVGDHAGNAIPARLGSLGLTNADLGRHIGWDIGVANLGQALAAELDATFMAQVYSRLVIDCNRSPGAPDAIPGVSDGTAIPGNCDLPTADRAARVTAIHEPYHAAIGAELARRDTAGADTILVALHSFTPVMQSIARPWHIGILHDGGDPGFGLACLAALRRKTDVVAGDNEPYRMDAIDYTVPRHAYPQRRLYVEIEVRQDLLQADPDRWCEIVRDMLTKAAGSCSAAEPRR